MGLLYNLYKSVQELEHTSPEQPGLQEMPALSLVELLARPIGSDKGAEREREKGLRANSRS
ncbi:hypothetical protein [Paenibacillus silvisoli]|uniref:hypothetical protein n=1 Tax=Paenibacillus silvisoli TaxID=3110539 RepID=UPI0028047478|nr:hypothetical protein [Paenibacillus silvisoli]